MANTPCENCHFEARHGMFMWLLAQNGPQGGPHRPKTVAAMAALPWPQLFWALWGLLDGHFGPTVSGNARPTTALKEAQHGQRTERR